MNRFTGIAEFVSTVEHKSFVLAAQQVGMTASGVSKAVSRLESRLGAKLLNRTTRSLSLTVDGALFYQRCHQLLVQLHDAENVVSRISKMPTGRLRVELPSALGRLHIMPTLPRFISDHPDLSVQAVFREQSTDLFDEGVDVAVRIGSVTGSGLIAQEIGITRSTTCASPGYLARFGAPRKPEDLLQHNCLTSVSAQTGQARDWHFSQGRTPFRLPVNGSLSMSNTDGLIQAAVNGIGITQVMDFVAMAAIREGLLRPVLTDWVAKERSISIVCLASQKESAKVKAFIKFTSGLFPLE